jgi:hypothetical protein
MAVEPTLPELEQYRHILRDEVEHSTLRLVASRVGMSPTGLQNFLDGTKPYGKTREKVRAWFYREYGINHLSSHDATMLLQRIVGTLPAPEPTLLKILEVVEAGYAGQGVQAPRWISGVRIEVSNSTKVEGI